MPISYCECGVKYDVDAQMVGTAARCCECGRVFTVADDSPTIPVSEHLDENEPAATEAEISQGNLVTPIGSPAASVLYVAEAASTRASSPMRYGTNLLWTLLFPSFPNNLMTFLIVWGIMVTMNMCKVLVIGLPFGLLFHMWYGAFLVTVLRLAAAGEPNIAEPAGEYDVIEDFFVPFFHWGASWLMALAPALLLLGFKSSWSDAGYELIRLGVDGVGTLQRSAHHDQRLFRALVWVGIALWPMIVMNVAIGGLGMLWRPDLMLRSAWRTWTTYLPVMMVMLLVALGAYYATIHFRANLATGVGAAGIQAFTTALVQLTAVIGASLYLDIVLMRLIGLYYHHHKRRFARSWG
ncbi:MAG: hypothetical protein ACYTHJ_23105 [Planctomycetota bacterium]